MRIRSLLSVGITALLIAGAHLSPVSAAPVDHSAHTAAKPAAKPLADPCASRESPASLRCGLAPSGVFDTKGRLWAAWSFGGHLYVNSSSDLGKSFTPPVPVNRIPEPVAGDGENRPKIALGRDGEIYVAWTQRLPKPYSGHVRFARSDDEGKSFSEPITVNDHLEITSHRFESMAVNDRGELFIAWIDKRDQLAGKEGYLGAALYYTYSSDGGRSFVPNRKIADHSCECCRTAMALDDKGLPVIAWRHVFGDHVRDHALVRFREAGQPAEPVRLSHEQWRIEACPHHGPALSMSGDTLHAAWFSNAQEKHGLFYAHSADGGATFSAPLPVGNYAAAANHPAVLARGMRIHLAWNEFDGERNRLLLMSSHDGGTHWGEPIAVATTAGNADHPQLLHDGSRAYLSWQTEREGFHLIPADGAPTP